MYVREIRQSERWVYFEHFRFRVRAREADGLARVPRGLSQLHNDRFAAPRRATSRRRRRRRRRKSPGAYGIRESGRSERGDEKSRIRHSWNWISLFSVPGGRKVLTRSFSLSPSLSFFLSLDERASWLPSKVESARQRVARPSSWDVDQPRQTCGMQHTYICKFLYRIHVYIYIFFFSRILLFF